MKYKRCNTKVIVRIDKGEEIVVTLKTLCKKLDIKLGTITGIGATDKVTIGVLDLKTKKYHSQEFIGDHEIASLMGTIAMMNGEVYLHLHINVCNAEQKSFGGHLISAVVSATFEGVIDIIKGEVNRAPDQNTGINLLNL